LIDIKGVRKNFPILDKDIIYLDNAASSLTPNPVIEKMLEFYHEYRSNIGRAIHSVSQKADDEFEGARVKIAELINAEPEEIIITKNTTEGINTVASGSDWNEKKKVVTTLIEHHSNYIVWLRLRNLCGIDVEIVRPNRRGEFNLADFEKAIDEKTDLVTLSHVSNVLGTIAPVKKVAQIAHDHNAKILIDAAQSVPHFKIDVKEIDCDYLVFSGHKILGPTGTGVLYMRKELMGTIEPLCIGGGTVKDVNPQNYELVRHPARFEAGTPAIGEVIGLGTAIDYLRKVGFEEIGMHEKKLIDKMYNGLTNIPGVHVYGPKDVSKRISIISFNIGNLNPHDIALALDITAKIMVRSGHLCAIPLMKELLGTPKGLVRASTYIYNTEDEVEFFISTVAEIAKSFIARA